MTTLKLYKLMMQVVTETNNLAQVLQNEQVEKEAAMDRLAAILADAQAVLKGE